MSLAKGDLMIEGCNETTDQSYREFRVEAPVTRLDRTPDIEVCGTSDWSIRTASAVMNLR